MSVQAILLPVFALVALTFIVLFWMARERRAALRSGQVDLDAAALGDAGWPPRATQLSRCFKNQFELPVLFYVLVAIATPLRQMDLALVLLSWIFVVTRYVHAGVFATSNNLRQRFLAYFSGMIVLLVMWIVFALKIVTVL